MIYDANNTRFKGTIDIENNTVAPVFSEVDGTYTSFNFYVDRAGDIAVQLFSDDIDASVAWTLQISLDGTNWATAVDSSGTDVTGTLVVDVPYVNIFRMQRYVLCRVSFTVTTETGNIAYIFRNDNDYS